MILSDYSIAAQLDSDKLVKRPFKIDQNQIQPASLDVRLGNEFVYPDTGKEIIRDDELTMASGDRILGHTKEILDLPDDIAAQLAGRSTIGRRGIIVHKTAGWIDPGFEGQVTLELYNLANHRVSLEIGSRIAQVVFLKLDQPSSGYDGKYQRQMGATTAEQ